MERYVWRARVVPGRIEEYIDRHDHIWPEMCQSFKEAGIRNYSIWNTGNDLFGYYECDSLEKSTSIRLSNPITQKWNEYMKDILIVDKDPVTGKPPSITQVFLFDEEKGEG